MADTTVDKVLAIAPHFSGLESSTIQLFIDDAIEVLKDTALEDSERAQRYLAAHFGSLTVRRTSTEKVESIKVEYKSSTFSVEGYKSTAYGQEFLEMSKSTNGIDFRLFS